MSRRFQITVVLALASTALDCSNSAVKAPAPNGARVSATNGMSVVSGGLVQAKPGNGMTVVSGGLVPAKPAGGLTLVPGGLTQPGRGNGMAVSGGLIATGQPTPPAAAPVPAPAAAPANNANPGTQKYTLTGGLKETPAR